MASFLTQYGLRIRTKEFETVSWDEFKALLAGLAPETPLGRVVSIRSETDEKIIKQFSREQKRIHDEWQEKQAARSEMMKFARELKKNPGRFNALAATCALRPDGRLSGAVPPFEPNKKQIYAAYEKAAVKLRPGEITPEPVETEAGLHLIRRDASLPNRQHSYEEVRDDLMSYLRERRKYEVLANYLTGLEKAAGVKFHIPMSEFN